VDPDPDPGGPKTCGSGGSGSGYGSATLVETGPAPFLLWSLLSQLPTLGNRDSVSPEGVCRVSRWSVTGGTLSTYFRLRSFLFARGNPVSVSIREWLALALPPKGRHSSDTSGFVPNPCSWRFLPVVCIVCSCGLI